MEKLIMENTWLLVLILSAMVAPIIPYELAVWNVKHRKNRK